MERLIITLTIFLFTTLLSLGLQAEDTKLTLKFEPNKLTQRPSQFSHEEIPGGIRFTAQNGACYDLMLTEIMPQILVTPRKLATGGYRYDFSVINQRDAKDPIRRITFSYNRTEVTEIPEYYDQKAPEGWESFANMFTGEMKPGQSARFSITSSLDPAHTMIILTGVDHEQRMKDREQLASQGVHLQFFRYIAQTLGAREYKIFYANEHPVKIGFGR